MSQPRTKRQFVSAAKDPSQRDITSFFPSAGRLQSTAPAVSSHEARGTGSGIGPKLPDSVQASLLNVGMRVRKSVPEGYKTIDGAYKPWAQRTCTSATPSSQTLSHSNSTVHSGATYMAQPANIGLLPYCGVNKIGDLSTQPMSFDSRKPDTADELPGLSCSQQTIENYDSENEEPHSNNDNNSQNNIKKRGFNSDDADDSAAFDLPMAYNGNGVSSRGSAVHMVYPDRVMAIPRKTRQQPVVVQDFDEAPFLDFDVMS
ncbi:hypothetical protein BROUX41_000908 [Berkeleyomyces rouxiae]|uniref:uncharacterized protein n=1 Tax=Berkeleyomyces rouxiae TaxID=2035830 RepID=UPI003B792018